MNNQLIIVTGFFGAPIEERARELAASKGFASISLDSEIERRDGRKINRLCMMAGEHGYRNQEYEVLNEINQNPESFCKGTGGLVIACGDGVLYDDESCEIALANTLVIIGEDMTRDELWEGAKAIVGTYHAFMAFGTDDEKRKAFDDYLDRQTILFERVRSNA